MEGLAVRAQFTVLAAHQGAPGLIHGGLLSAAIDEAMGSLAYLLMTPAVTGRLEVDFRRPIPVGSAVVIDARVIAQHGRKIYTSAVVAIEEESATAHVGRGAGLFVQVPLEHFTRHGSPEFVSEAQQDRTEAFERWAVNP
jgi:acyl-coenzyme A thioesterase PaaI-like protein